MEEIAEAGYDRFEEFQNKFYWTSQPAYTKNIFYYEYRARFIVEYVQDAYHFVVYEDNTDYARATKAVYRNGEFSYALSGLNDEPNDPNDYETLPSNEVSQGTKELGYYYMWHAWKRPPSGDGAYSNSTSNQVYTRYENRSKKDRYYAYLGHLLDMKQEGYMKRTDKARVRCVRKVNVN